MKLAKKMVACVLALALAAVLGCAAFAAPNGVSMTAVVTPTELAPGSTFTVTIKATGTKGCATLMAELNYNADVIEFVSVEKKSDMFAFVEAGCAEAGDITASCMQSDPATVDEGVVSTYTFKCLKAGDMGLKFVNATATDTDDNEYECKTSVQAVEVLSELGGNEDAPADNNGTETTAKGSIQQTGEASIAVVAGVMAVAAVAFVATRKRDAE